MEKISYTTLSVLWKKQREMYGLWGEALINQAKEVRNNISKYIGAPGEPWVNLDTHKKINYIELVDIGLRERPPAAQFSKESYTNDGELLFGISVTFDYQDNSYPKSIYHIPLVVRYSQQNPQYNFWDTINKCPEADSSWYSSIDSFSKAVTERLNEYLEYDPFDGIIKKNNIGFISDQ